MQTFLPFPKFKKSVMALDPDRLGKQRAEVKQLLIAIYWDVLKKNIFLAEAVLPDPYRLNDPKYERSYRTIAAHPACRMWEDYPMALIAYGMACCQEWVRRGKKDNTYATFESFAALAEDVFTEQNWLEANMPELIPKWIGDENFHRSHRQNLIRKEPAWYEIGLGWTDGPSDEYFWPHEHEKYV